MTMGCEYPACAGVCTGRGLVEPHPLPRSVFFEAGLDALLVAFDEAEVVLGLVFSSAIS